jgi:hypothetical protein
MFDKSQRYKPIALASVGITTEVAKTKTELPAKSKLLVAKFFMYSP